MRLTCYSIHRELNIIPAPVKRDWMDATRDFAYRCLPLNIANQHGWVILNDEPFISAWNGGDGLEATTLSGDHEDAQLLANSHFGFGVLTFHLYGLFRTEPGYNLLCTGPFNSPKDSISPLTGIIETDWSPFTFTMNWKFTRPFAPIRFERDEPFCMIFPVKRNLIEQVDPKMCPITNHPPVHEIYNLWSNHRDKFNADLKIRGSDAERSKWQKDYFRGSTPFGTAPADHQTTLRLNPFRKRT